MTRLKPRLTVRLTPRMAAHEKADYGHTPVIPTASQVPTPLAPKER